MARLSPGFSLAASSQFMWFSAWLVDWLPLNIFCVCARTPIGNLLSLLMTSLRDLPSIEKLLQDKRADHLINQYGRPLTLDALRSTLDEIRARFKSDPQSDLPSNDV